MESGKTPILHPFLLAIFPPLFLFAQNFEELFYSQSLMPILAMSIFSVIMWFILKLFIKSSERVGLILSCIIILTFSYLNFATFVMSLFRLDMGRYSLFFIGVWFIILVFALWVISRLNKSLVNWTKIANIIAVCLISFSLVKIAPSIPGKIAIQKKIDAYVDHKEFEKPEGMPATLPNIYYLVLDGHIGFETMERFGYDSSDLKNNLHERGFFIAEQSKSNYPWTVQAMPSTLNFKYMEFATSGDNLIENIVIPLNYMMDNNHVFNFLKTCGYTTIHCSTYVGNKTTWIDSADKVLIHHPWYFSDISLELLGNTPFYLLLKPLIAKQDERIFNLKQLLHKRRIEKSFDEIQNAVNFESPFILYAHIICPHAPFIYNENGQTPEPGDEFSGIDVESYPEKTQDYLRKYFAQMTHLDNKIMNIIDHIKTHSKEPPIIIVQGDHGIRQLLVESQKDNQTKISPGTFPEVYSILNAYHLPGFDYSQLPDSITPVNTFPIIFNLEF